MLLTAPLIFAAAGGAGAQTMIGPGSITSTVNVTSPGATVVGNTQITIPVGSGGSGIINLGGGALTLDTTAGPNPGVAIIIHSPGSGVFADGAGSSITGITTTPGSLSVNSSGGANGIDAENGATLDLPDGATVTSVGGVGVRLGGSDFPTGSIGNLTDVNITATASGIGVAGTRSGTVVTMMGGSITVLGDGSLGLFADTRGVINLTNVPIMMNGSGSIAAFAESTLGGSVATRQTYGSGTINITGGSITNSGASATGAFADGMPSTITLNGTAVTMTGDNSLAYNANAGTITATNATTMTSGASSPAGVLSNGGILRIDSGSVTTTGARSFGFLVEPVSPVPALTPGGPGPVLDSMGNPDLSNLTPITIPGSPGPNILTINSATVHSAADAFHVQGAAANIAVNGSSVTSSNGVLLNTLAGSTQAEPTSFTVSPDPANVPVPTHVAPTSSTSTPGVTNLTATGSQVTGTIVTDSASTANVTLQGDSTWTMTGNSNLTNLVNDPSNIIFTPPVGDPTLAGSYKTLTVVNYTGVAGSRITLNTYLGTDNSPSDQLVISGGSATGMTGLTIHNSGGPGAETASNGIPVVVTTIGGSTSATAFALSNEVRAGAFDYDLFHGGINGSDPNNWFLRSTFDVGPPGTLPPIPPFPTDPPPQPSPPGVYPIIGPELATDGVVQPIARQMGFTMLGTLHERIGDTLTEENAGNDAEGWGRSGWARFFGQQFNNRYQSFADPSTTGRLFGVQAGFDIWRGSFIPGHRDAAGVYFAYGNSAMDVNGLVTNAAATGYVFARTGTVNLYAYSGGAYWTHYGPGGWYLDAVVQGTAYTGNATTQFANLPTDGSGIITSLEAGYPIQLPLGPRFILEPQGQILWQHTSFGQANDGLGPVALGTTSGATGRLGVRGQWTIASDNGLVWQPYARANLWQNWSGNATTTFGIDQVPLLQQSTQLEFAAGLTTKINDVLSFYVQAGYMFGIGGDTEGGRRQGVKGDIGLRLTFGHPPPPPSPVAMPAPAAARSYLVFFDWDKATLTDRARQIIREAAVNSTHVQYTRIEANGYTDTSGTPKYNQGLSVRRAEAVAAELVRDGVPRNVITIQGFGETHLLVPTGPGVREPQNRRVEIVVL